MWREQGGCRHRIPNPCGDGQNEGYCYESRNLQRDQRPAVYEPGVEYDPENAKNENPYTPYLIFNRNQISCRARRLQIINYVLNVLASVNFSASEVHDLSIYSTNRISFIPLSSLSGHNLRSEFVSGCKDDAV